MFFIDNGLEPNVDDALKVFQIDTLTETVLGNKEKEINELAKRLYLYVHSIKSDSEISYIDAALLKETYLNKAEKIYDFFVGFGGANRFVQYITMLKPELAKQVIDSI